MVSPAQLAFKALVDSDLPLASGRLWTILCGLRADEAAAGLLPAPVPAPAAPPAAGPVPDRPSKRARRSKPTPEAVAAAEAASANAVSAVTDLIVAAAAKGGYKRVRAADLANLQLAMAEAEAIAFI